MVLSIRLVLLAILLATLAIFSMSGTFAFAQDVSVDTGAQATVETNGNMRGRKLEKRPLKDVREKLHEIKQNTQNNRMELKEDWQEFRAEADDTKSGIREDSNEFRQDLKEKRKKMREDVRTDLKVASTTEEKKAIRKEARDDRAKFRDKIKAESEIMRADFKERRGTLKDKRRELVGDNFAAIMSRLINTLERFDKILARIDSRIEKLKAQGIDTAQAVKASVSASAALDVASIAVAKAQSALGATSASSTPRDQIKTMRIAVQEAINATKVAHRTLKDALQILKNLPKPKGAADFAEIEAEIQ